MVLPSWISASTGPQDLIPHHNSHSKPVVRPKTRPTLVPPMRPISGLESLLDDRVGVMPPASVSLAILGTIKRGSPPPNSMRIFGQFALLFSLAFSLMLVRVLGG